MSHLLVHVTHGFVNISSIHSPRLSTTPCLRRWLVGLTCMSARNNLESRLPTSQLNSRSPPLRTTWRVPNVKHSCNRCRATPYTFLLGVGNTKRNVNALWTATKIYSVSGKEVVPIQSKSTSRTSQGSTARAVKRVRF